MKKFYVKVMLPGNQLAAYVGKMTSLVPSKEKALIFEEVSPEETVQRVKTSIQNAWEKGSFPLKNKSMWQGSQLKDLSVITEEAA